MNMTSKATLKRYPIYLKALKKIKAEGKERIMSNELSEYVNIKPTTIRRDFSLIGSLGKQGFGYSVDKLIETFSKELGGNFNEKIILVGVGNLGRALLHYNKWDDIVGEIVCAFDIDPEACCCKENVIPIYDIHEIREKLPEGCRIALLCISDNKVQKTVDLLAEIGIKGIIDLTHVHYNVPKGVTVKSIDVISTIQELVFETNLEH